MSQSGDDLNVPILNLTAQEKTAYSYLFGLADADSLNIVTGERAVSFFEKTHVPEAVLGEAWQIADTENRGFLTKPGFCMVLRLIGWYQNGQRHPSTELAFKPAPLPVFDGMTLPGATASPSASPIPGAPLQPQLSGQTTGGAPIRVPPLDPTKVQQYSALFGRSGAQNGLLAGPTAKSIFEKAGLPNETLGKIWMLADRDQRGALDETDFIVAMHLLTSVKTRTMTGLPASLPPGLYEAASRRGQRPPSRQTSIQSTVIPRQLTGNAGSTIPRTQSPLARPPSSSYSTPPIQSAQPTGAHWLVTQQEKAQYDQFFSTIDTSGQGLISGEQAVRFFSDSRLPEDTLASIWDLADIKSEGHLNRDEFAVAMYLIRQQRAPNAAPLPAFLPSALVPPSMRGPQQIQQAQRDIQQPSAFAAPVQSPPRSKSAADDLFGLDEPSQATPTQGTPVLQPQGTGASASRDPFAGSQPGTPSSPSRSFQPSQSTSSTFKPFIPTSAFGASLAAENRGGSGTPPVQGQQSPRGPAAPMPSNFDDLLGENDTHAQESRSITNDSTELANMSNQIGNLRNQMETTQTKRTATAAELNATSAQKKDLEQRLQQFRTQYEAEVRAVKDMEQQLTASRESTKKLGQDLALLQGTHQDLQTQHNTLSQQLQADQQENASLKQRIGQINAEVTQLKPQIEKMKMDARQQKGLVSINKKQLATNEAERDRLQTEKADLERSAAEQSRSLASSPEPVAASPVVSPAASVVSMNPFLRRTNTTEATASPGPSAPNPSAFDSIFGPSTAFAPTGQTNSRSGTPPVTSFIGRSMPEAGTVAAVGAGAAAVGAAAIGGAALAESKSSAGEPALSATPSLSDRTREPPVVSAEPPPPPEGSQFTPTNLPLSNSAFADSGKAESVASSTRVIPPASRAGGVETPREAASSPLPWATSTASTASAFAPEQTEHETIPGAFPAEDRNPSIAAQEVASSNEPSQNATPTPPPPPPQAKPADDFDSAFASFGEGDKSRDADASNHPFSSSSSVPAKPADPEFPPIQDLGGDESDTDDDGERGFGDDFGAPSHSGAVAPASAVGGTSTAAVGEAPDISKDASPPTYENIGDAPAGTIGHPTSPNSFPREYGNLLPAREDPTSPPPPPENQAVAGPPDIVSPVPQRIETQPQLQAEDGDAFVDASSRPMSSHAEVPSLAQAAPAPTAQKSVFDEFDDFHDLSEAQEHDRSGNDLDFFGRQSHDEFNPAFDSPAASQTPTPMKSLSTAADSNGFGNFAPSASTSSAFAPAVSTSSAFAPAASTNSVQQTPENTQHDWDAIFSGLDSNKPVAGTNNTAFASSNDDTIWQPPPGPPPGRAPIGTNGNTASSVVSPTPQTATAAKAARPNLGRAITPGTEHDDPILKRLTGMGYSRTDALRALERYDYDINKVRLSISHVSDTCFVC
ncbi:hypothetical protein BDY17DRAFT_349903 [Neohortaea acidophila]|uniref:Uncharacterized protein n=1 Tax=Neohortaea acidophila TaxID=245834 RepID=A0A6A6PG08_9PEZI|nr:uncharacterized protein BDY17DRAFT_349903 [Neohortaea acidophila]KAF2478899.1 hypothetical protein BDY17DRAFT_349903 [Neohortaea acidophila]